jgi:alcohol dehydrogenase YqhD (iron-dependent ADH family)
MQKEFFGKNSLDNIRLIISEIGAKKILLVTGKDSYKQSGSEIIRRILSRLFLPKNSFCIIFQEIS